MNKKELLDLLNQVRNPNDDNYFSKDWLAESILKLKKCDSCGNFCDNIGDTICVNCKRDSRIDEIL
jgi:recombinational DNA repair protein RecR